MLLTLDDLRHSYVDLDDPRHLEFDYVRWLADSIDGFRARPPLDAVFAGGAASPCRAGCWPSAPGRGPRVLEVDRRHRRRWPGGGWGCGPHRRCGSPSGDARVTLRGVPADSADLVVGDAFGAEAVPWHLATARVDRATCAGCCGPAGSTRST